MEGPGRTRPEPEEPQYLRVDWRAGGEPEKRRLELRCFMEEP